MKPIVSKSVLLPLLAAVLVLFNSSRVFGYVNQASPDSVWMSASVHDSTDAYIVITDGRDTIIPPNQTKGTIQVSLTGSSEFRLITDSIIQFVGETVIRIRYSPTSLVTESAEVEIIGDSNTLYVPITGNAMSHSQIQLLTGNYDSLTVNQVDCQNFEIHNTNADSIWITSVTLQQKGSAWELYDMPSFPVAIPGNTTVTIGQLCVQWVLADSEQLIATVNVAYSYGSGSDFAETTVQGDHRPVQTSCITSIGGDFGNVAAGSSETQTITLINVSDSDVYLDSTLIGGTDYSQFTINSPSFPMVLPKGDSMAVSITFSVPSVPSKDGYSAFFESQLYGMSQDGMPCNPLYVSLKGGVNVPVVDSITLDVPPGTNTLSFTAHTTLSRHAIFIHNADTSKLLLQSLIIDDTNGIAFFGSQGIETLDVYDSLGIGATSDPIMLTLQAPDTGTYDIELTLTFVVQGTHKKTVITGNTGSDVYKVVAHRLPPTTEGVSESLPQVADFSINPNPASGEVIISVDNAREAKIEIFDLLGNRLTSFDNIVSHTWDPAGQPNGVYIVRASGADRNGAPFVISQRLVLAR